MKESIKKPGRQSRNTAQQTKERIIQAALQLFAEQGFYDAKLRDIAAVAHTTHSLISHHFGSKDKLWRHVVDLGLEKRAEDLRRVMKKGKNLDTVELFKQTIISHISFYAEHVEFAKILQLTNCKTGPHFDYVLEKQQCIHELVEPIFKKMQKKGYFTFFDHDSFTVYMRALAEVPFATTELNSKLLGHDIRSQEGIHLHTERVLAFLFP